MTMPADTPTHDVRRIAERLTKGAAKACIAMTAEWTFPGKATFTANGAHALRWHRSIGGTGILAEYAQMRDGPKRYRTAYRLTPLGEQVAAHLKETSGE